MLLQGLSMSSCCRDCLQVVLSEAELSTVWFQYSWTDDLNVAELFTGWFDIMWSAECSTFLLCIYTLLSDYAERLFVADTSVVLAELFDQWIFY